MFRRALAAMTLAALLLGPLPGQAAADTTTAATMLAYHNELRATLGLPAARADSRVATAAQRHAEYNAMHGITGHTETPGWAGFTGVNARDRLAAQGYFATWVSEVAASYSSWRGAMTELWAAPYHRLGMMHPHNVVAGWGHSSSGGREATVGNFVYDFNSPAPSIVRSPAAGQAGVPTSWNGNESPSPLPAGAARPTGYPIMLISGNARATTLRSASLVRVRDGASLPYYVAPQVYEYDYAVIIPQRPLEVGTQYRVRMDLTVAGQPVTESWTFTTSANGLLSLATFHSAWSGQSDPPALVPGGSATVTVRFKNTGTESWQRGVAGKQVNLAVAGDSTAFAALGMGVGWLSANRVATTSEATVASGQVGTFTFTVRAPTAVGTYRIPLHPVVEGVQWLEDQGVFVPVVVDGGFHSAWVSQSPYPTVSAGTTTLVTVSLRNAGQRSWVKGILGQEARVGVVNDETRWSSLGVGWLYPNRPTAQAEPTVLPGGVGTFTFAVRAPSTRGVYEIRLRPVIDGVTWMEDQGVFLRITVP